jgi:hypothetical protein
VLPSVVEQDETRLVFRQSLAQVVQLNVLHLLPVGDQKLPPEIDL